MRPLTFNEAEKLLYEKRDRFKSLLKDDLDPNYRVKMGNDIEVHRPRLVES